MPDRSDWQAEVELHRIDVEARAHRNAFLDKLAILDGGTVALVHQQTRDGNRVGAP